MKLFFGENGLVVPESRSGRKQQQGTEEALPSDRMLAHDLTATTEMFGVYIILRVFACHANEAMAKVNAVKDVQRQKKRQRHS